MEKETIKPGKYAEIVYKLYEVGADGKETLIYESEAEEPEKLIFGVTRGILPVLEKALDGLAAGEKFDVTASPEQAFGHHDPEQVVELGREVFEVDGKFDEENIKVGARLPMMTADGYRIDGLVTELTPTSVKMDFNHPLVDKTVRFDGEIKTVRDATPDELSPAQGCGCGCGDHDHCGDDCGCDHDHCGSCH
ncbi:MAG: FKBP-type peptidyl-prolyl cis-trans isomerase [Muribaculaceae bacterium]|nr:FKBP-type peptidyl-prolyl cis-trans isomerase [Muribaculaceae bacterium]